MDCPLVWIIIGVAGSGKTTIGRQLAARLDSDFIEGDRRHPRTNIQKMTSGVPLTDDDRGAWLNDLAGEAQRAVAAGRELVVSCSALKRSYREQLRVAGRVQFVLPVLPQDILLARLAARPNHFMKREMLESQIRIFEMPAVDEEVWTIDGSKPAMALVDEILRLATKQWPTMTQEWWDQG